MKMTSVNEKVSIVGSGLIGKSWSMLFASVGFKVCLYDIEPQQIEAAKADIKSQLEKLESTNLLRGNLTAEEQFSCISGSTSLSEALKGSIYIQECVPENLNLKKQVFKNIDELMDSKTILASSTSTFMPSFFTEELKNRKNVVVAHPVNPPYYVPLVEIVPAPWTESWVVQKSKGIMEKIGMSPVTLTREIPGFALNRIQYVILNECWNLVKDGVLNVEDIDKVMSEGLGMRYAFLGPLETAHLNAEGFENYCQRYSESMFGVCQTMNPVPPKFEGVQVKEISNQLCEKIPLDKLADRRAWRDKCLTQLSVLKTNASK